MTVTAISEAPSAHASVVLTDEARRSLAAAAVIAGKKARGVLRGVLVIANGDGTGQAVGCDTYTLGMFDLETEGVGEYLIDVDDLKGLLKVKGGIGALSFRRDFFTFTHEGTTTGKLRAASDYPEWRKLLAQHERGSLEEIGIGVPVLDTIVKVGNALKVHKSAPTARVEMGETNLKPVTVSFGPGLEMLVMPVRIK